jgi:hypothetical protein
MVRWWVLVHYGPFFARSLGILKNLKTIMFLQKLKNPTTLVKL